MTASGAPAGDSKSEMDLGVRAAAADMTAWRRPPAAACAAARSPGASHGDAATAASAAATAAALPPTMCYRQRKAQVRSKTARMVRSDALCASWHALISTAGNGIVSVEWPFGMGLYLSSSTERNCALLQIALPVCMCVSPSVFVRIVVASAR